MNKKQNELEEIQLPELSVSPEWRAENPDVDPITVFPESVLTVLLENNRKVTLVRVPDEDTESKKMRTCAIFLPVHPNVLRSVIEGHNDIEAFVHESQLVLITDGDWHTEDLHRFYGWRDMAHNILGHHYPVLWNKLKELNPDVLTMTDAGIQCVIGGVDMSTYYSPEEIVSRDIAARAINEKLVFNAQEIRNTNVSSVAVVIPEISGNVTYEMMAEYFNSTLKNLPPKYAENGIFTAFFARAHAHDGIDIVTVLPNGNGGYVNLSLCLSLYLYGTKQMQPALKLEGDMFVVSYEDTDEFVSASVAQWIDFKSFANDYNLV